MAGVTRPRERWAQRFMRSPLLAPVYEKAYRPFLGWAFMGFNIDHLRNEQPLTVQSLRLGPGDVVLDVACGPGLFTRAFAAAVAPTGLAVGMDTSSPMLARARRANAHSRAAYVFGDATDQPFQDDSFDAVNCYGALYLIPDPFTAFGEVLRVLRPGGRLSLMTSRESPFAVVRPVQARALGLSGLRMFSVDEFTTRLRDAGFTEITQEIHGVAQYVAATAPV